MCAKVRNNWWVKVNNSMHQFFPFLNFLVYDNNTPPVFFLLKLLNYTFKHVEEQYGHEMMKNRMDRFFARVSY